MPTLSPVPTDADVAEEMAANADTAVDLLPPRDPVTSSVISASVSVAQAHDPVKGEDVEEYARSLAQLHSKDTSTTEDTKAG